MMRAQAPRHSRCTAIVLLSFALALATAPTMAMAKTTVTFKPKKPPATMNFTVLPDGTIQGAQMLKVTITRKENPSAVLQSCTKIRYVTIKAFEDHRYAIRDAGWVDMRNHPLCNFTKTITYYPFDGDVIRGLCLGNSAAHRLKSMISVSFSHADSGLSVSAPTTWNYGKWGTGIVAHITCRRGAGASPQPTPPANVRPVNACSLGGSWPVWRTAPGRQAAVPFVLTANQGRSDVYQVSAPNHAGVTGTAVVSGYKVTISLQGGNGSQMQSFSGAFDRSCSTLSGQAVRSNAPFTLTATHRGGGYTTQSVHSSRSRPAPVKAKPHTTFGMPHVNTRVAPKWNLNTR